jgi:hypothetical protein
MELLGQYKVRKLTSNNKTGDVIGITLPKKIKTIFSKTTVSVYLSGNQIILTSGTKLTKEEIYNHNKKQRPINHY